MWHQIDDEMLSQELKSLMNGEHEMVPVPLTSEPDFRERPHEEVEEEFYQLAESLVSKSRHNACTFFIWHFPAISRPSTLPAGPTDLPADNKSSQNLKIS